MPPLFPADAADANRRDRAHAWYAAYYEAIYRYTYMKMQNNDEAGIAASDAFVRMMQNADKLAALNDDEVRRRLFGYARAACFDLLRKKLPQKTLAVVSVSDAETNDQGERFDAELADETDLLARILQKETRDAIATAIQTLDPIARQIVVLKYYSGLKNTEIAAQLRMNASTVGTILQRSLKKLRKELEAYVYGENHGKTI
ncbi:MAG: sigma-70 family RNA polymerase sigma factor [Clostridia bacterium]|nr:sigma-70 family RNA polymerase sigma factor [Clostridia bacterium]